MCKSNRINKWLSLMAFIVSIVVMIMLITSLFGCKDETRIATVTCADNTPSCLSSPFCVGNVEGTACGSAGGMCTKLANQPLLHPCCSCDNSGGGGGSVETFTISD